MIDSWRETISSKKQEYKMFYLPYKKLQNIPNHQKLQMQKVISSRPLKPNRKALSNIMWLIIPMTAHCRSSWCPKNKRMKNKQSSHFLDLAEGI